MEQEHDTNDLDTLLAQHSSEEHVQSIRDALEQVGLPLDGKEIRMLIVDYPTLGPGTFHGFGSTPKEHQEVSSVLHAIRMMLNVHHDDPWREYEIGGEG